ncbi:phage tail protein [Lysinibacillus sp. VIII_CA]
MNGFGASISRLHVSSNGLSASFGGLQSTLVGLASAYVGAQGAAKLFESTIGAAARYEQSSTILASMMNDAGKYKQYMKMIDTVAIDSPLLNSADMVSGSKGLLTLTKDMGTLEKAWSTIEKLNALNPDQGVDGAVYSFKALASGDAESIVDRFDMNRADINPLKGLSFAEQIKGLDAVLAKMNITDDVVEKMGATTLGRWNSLKERTSTIFRDMGKASNTKLGDFLKRINDSIGKLDVKSISDKLGSFLGKATDKAIALYDLFVKWREPIAYAAGAIGTFVAALAVVGTIAALANPISLIAMGIAAAAVGFKALYDNSETFRGAIDGIIGKVKSLFSAFKSGGTSGLINALFPPGVAKKVNAVINGIKTKVSELINAFKKGGVGGLFDEIFGKGSFELLKTKFEEVKAYISEKVTQFMPVFERLKATFSTAWSTVSDILSSAWDIISPILSGLWDWIQMLGDVVMIVYSNVIAPAISFVVQLFSTLWTIAKPILEGLAWGFEKLSSVIKWVWDNILAPFIDFITTVVKAAFDTFSGVLSTLQGWFETLSGWVSTAYGHVKDFIGFLGNVKLPDWVTKGVSTTFSFVGNLFGGGKGGKPDGSHYHGLDNVRYDGYRAVLHKGEAVLNRQEADAYRNGQAGGGISIAKLAEQIVIREDADIDTIAFKLAKAIEREMYQAG